MTLPVAAKPVRAEEPARLPMRKLPPLVDAAIPALAVITGVMLFFSVPNIVTGDDAWSYAKALFLAASATIVAFGVNKLAIERGAPLATKGYAGAAIVSLVSMPLVGAGLFAATFSGLVLPDVALLQLQQHGTELAEFAGERGKAAAEAGRAGPAVRTIIHDLTTKRDCELREACLSGKGGGRGPVTRALESLVGRAAAVGNEIGAGETARQNAVREFDAQIEEYQRILADAGIDIWQRRAKLQAVAAQMTQTAAALDEVMPLALLAAYAAELDAGTSLPGTPEADSKVNALLEQHGASLSAVLASIKTRQAPPPPFPRRTGVADAFDYLGHFLPIAAITAVVELLFPLVLWAYTFWALSWDIFRNTSATTPSGSGFRPRPGATSSTPSNPKVVADVAGNARERVDTRRARRRGRRFSRQP